MERLNELQAEAVVLLEKAGGHSVGVARRGAHGRSADGPPRGARHRRRAAVQQRLRARAAHFDAAKPTLLLNSHHDTVRPTAAWTRDPFAATWEGERLYGLGANDAGASVAAPHGRLPPLLRCGAAFQPAAGPLGRGGVHGRTRHAGAAARTGADRHGARGRADADAGGRRRTRTGSAGLHGARPRRPCGARRGDQRPSTSLRTTSHGCAVIDSNAARRCWGRSA